MKTSLKLLIISLIISLFNLGLQADERLSVDTSKAVKTITNQLKSDLIQNLYEGSEKALIDETEFKILLEPYSNYVDLETPFTTQALDFYNKIKDDTQNLSTSERKQYFNTKFQGYVNGYVKGMVYNKVFDKESQEIISTFNSMLSNAYAKIKAITAAKKEIDLSEDSAEYATILKKYGITGKWVDNVALLENNMNFIQNSKTANNLADIYKAYSIISTAMESDNPGHKIEALFELGATFGGKVPILGDFIELYFKVAQEYLKACKGISEKLRKFDQYCVGVGTHGWINGAYADERNVAFAKQFKYDGGTYCRGAGGIYKDIYTATSETGATVNRLYFWVKDRWILGEESHGGMQALSKIVRWLRSNGHADKATDIFYLAREYNKGRGFIAFVDTIEKIVDDLYSEYHRIYETIGTCEDSLVQKYMMQDAKMYLIQEFLGKERNYTWEEIRYFYDGMKADMIDEFIYRRLIKPEASNLGKLLNALKSLHPSFLSGHVYDKYDSYVDGADVAIDGASFLFKNSSCYQLHSSAGGYFHAIIELHKAQSVNLTLRATKKDKTSKPISLSIKADSYHSGIKIYLKAKESSYHPAPVPSNHTNISSTSNSSEATIEPPVIDTSSSESSEESASSISIPDCLQDSDCLEGEICSDEICIVASIPDCISDDECPSGEMCSDEICIMAEPDCISDSECNPGEICLNEVCITYVPECTSNSQCPSDKICKDETCVIAPPQVCQSDHDCPLDKICSLSNICIASSNGGYNENVWGEREADREQEIDDRYAQDTAQEILDDRYNQDELEKERNERMEQLAQNNKRENSEHSHHTTTSKPSTQSQSSTTSNPATPSKVSKPSKPSKVSKPSESKLKYYVVTERSRLLNRTSICNTTSYTIVGPFDTKKINAYIKEQKKYSQKRMSRYGYPIYTKISVTKDKGSTTRPASKKGINKCVPCPAGQHIGLDKDKQKCHGEKTKPDFSNLKNFGGASQKGSW